MTKSILPPLSRSLFTSSYLLSVLSSGALAACSAGEESSPQSMSWDDSGMHLRDSGTGGTHALSSGGGTAAGGDSNSGQGSGAATSSSGGQSNTGGNSASSGGANGGPALCVDEMPPQEFVASLNATWQEMTGQIAAQGAGARQLNASVLNFDNTILDQIMENDGSLNYCVRYESDVVLSATQRDKLEAALERNMNEWVAQLGPLACFPYESVAVKVVGWAAMNRNTFDWGDGDHPGKMYIGDDSFESAPQCSQSCGRFFHREPGYQYPACEGGRANHYDMSLWLTEGMSGGAGGDWGQRVGRGYFTGAIDSPTLHILSHEMGHGFGFPDYYNWNTWFPGISAPHSIMVAGAAAEVTTWDKWMFNRLWQELRDDRFSE